LRDTLLDNFPNTQLIFDKKIDNGCSLKRPDVRIECFTHTIIIECDEYSHKNYTCESKRIMELFKDLGNRPLVVLRFNPDNYNGKTCFNITKKIGSLQLQKKEWEIRTQKLKERINFYKNNVPKKELIQEYLFYNKY